MGLIYFSWPDYLLVAIVLAVSAGIGFYYAFTGGKQKTTKEYLLADKGMHWFPVTCSLIATFESSLSLLGLPGEIYTFGTVIIYSFIFKPIGVIIAAKFYLPVFRKMGGISLYKYVRERYGRVIQMFMLVAGTFQMLMFCSLIMFGPALSISAVTGVNIWLAVISVAGVAIIYTVLVSWSCCPSLVAYGIKDICTLFRI
ncbi:SLC5A6 [Bugula neritina]|uniref:SLC5A6 n=1 Tax=Bugula neritina TaxID=10212 RepID=A0A7J7JNY9_BUGNE|nr:SLC5A6 [Bugula neritina]